MTPRRRGSTLRILIHISRALLMPIRAYIARRRRLASVLQGLIDRFPSLQAAVNTLIQGDPQEGYEKWIAAYDTLDESDVAAMRDEQSRFDSPPLLSLIVPLDQASEATLEALTQSLLAQVYERWELHFVGRPPVDDPVTMFVSRAPSLDPRIRPFVDRGESFADGWTAAVQSAEGEFVVLADPQVAPRPHALFVFARTIERDSDALLIYADEDAIDPDGTRSSHYFKPDWNEALLSSQNYLGGLVCFSRSLALAAGAPSQQLDGDYGWSLFLQMTVNVPPRAIHHVPFILYHRRVAQPARQPTRGDQRARTARALEEQLMRIGKRAAVEPVGESSYRTRYVLPDKPPDVSVVVPSTCELGILRPCLDGLLHRTSYPRLEILVVANGMRGNLPAKRAYLDAVAAESHVRVLFYDGRPYNFARLNNWAVEHARGELLCFLNDDTEVIGTDWLSAMVAHAVQDNVAAVGAMLIYPNETIQHAGVVLGVGGVAGHAYSRRPRGIRGYHDRAVVDQDASCVTAACMLVKRGVFLDVGGFDERLAIAYNDVDLCLRLREVGWRIVWTPSAELYHKESASIGRHDAGPREADWTSEWNLVRTRWGDQFVFDPQYNPNLSLDAFQLWEPAFPPRVFCPWRTRSHA
jgi:GT2 family glycosyltransferase